MASGSDEPGFKSHLCRVLAWSPPLCQDVVRGGGDPAPHTARARGCSRCCFCLPAGPSLPWLGLVVKSAAQHVLVTLARFFSCPSGGGPYPPLAEVLSLGFHLTPTSPLLPKHFTFSPCLVPGHRPTVLSQFIHQSE